MVSGSISLNGGLILIPNFQKTSKFFKSSVREYERPPELHERPYILPEPPCNYVERSYNSL
jgi:hypothetical protein